ncbi:MAG: hypothetical protein HOC57_04965 [Rhodospirillaceae bacterium]|nr:hypothetical protein [Rhodospirillaceae bacterium]MBT4588615.1 hypothetical protein [Rhodospirillaceae bacterium]
MEKIEPVVWKDEFGNRRKENILSGGTITYSYTDYLGLVHQVPGDKLGRWSLSNLATHSKPVEIIYSKTSPSFFRLKGKVAPLKPNYLALITSALLGFLICCILFFGRKKLFQYNDAEISAKFAKGLKSKYIALITNLNSMR